MFLGRVHHEMRLRLPDVHDELMAAQCHVLRLEDVMPEHLYDGGRAGDEDLAVYQIRRVVLDRVVLSEADVAAGSEWAPEPPAGKRPARRH